ncbi:MAG: ArsR family transcriptional regulator [Alphaproteobacteria bacterium]|nr:ArsR family transcriptional regulator [Alphaproteobacteria bacterium]
MSKIAPRRRHSATRRTIQHLLKQHGPQDAGALASELGISAMAVRQHLYALREEGLIDFDEESRPVGRPAKLWRLTAAANALFPNGHADLIVELIQSTKTAFGPDGMDRLIEVRAEHQITAYRQQVDNTKTLRNRLQRLAKIRTEEGYMATVEKDDNGAYMLIENHCPICTAAAACTGICAAELSVFQAVLGPDVTVERTDHILAGARRCAYRIVAP